ncbi:MAG: HEAT repeat domain-containing protein [Planctomycetota bacterium]|nr:HEAT repeat domain-containing protein [Planctomycetota bacterium]MDP7250593.1 HEAT repeat domain-containing protein [Planctomycetota bacterium]
MKRNCALLLPILLLGGCGIDTPAERAIKKLKSSSPEEREAGAMALGQLHQQKEDSIPALRKALKDKEVKVKIAAATALAAFGEDAAECAPEILALTDGADNKVKYRAMSALASIKAEKELVEAATKLLKDSDPEVKMSALQALYDLGAAAAPAVGPLSDACKDQDSNIRLMSAKTIGNIGKDASSAIPALNGLMGDKEPFVRDAAREALSKVR